MNKKLLNYFLTLLFFILISPRNLSAQVVANALDFDGVDDRVDCGPDTSLNIKGKALTIEAWIYNTAFKTNSYDGSIINKEYNTSNYGYMLRCGAGGKLSFNLGDGSWHEIISVTTPLTLNTWYHVAGTYDGTKMRMYVNGVCTDSLAWSGSINNSTTVNLTIGDHTGAYTRRFQGQIDEVRVWAVCRTAAQIKANMNGEFCSGQKGLRAYYKFNQGKPAGVNTVKTLTDLSGNNNTGTLQNFTLAGSGSNWVTGVSLTRGSSAATWNITRCDRYTSPSGKYKWINSGTYKDTIPTYMGCDSTLTLNVKILKKTTKTINAFACKSYTSPSGGYTWTTSGTYTDYLVNAVGCDSVITIKLKIGGTPDTIRVSDCKQFISPSKKYTFTATGVYHDTLVDFRGCDSLITIYFTKLPTTTYEIFAKNCRQYVSPSGKHTYTATGTYYDTLVNQYGCDSIIKINFKNLTGRRTINPVACEFYKSPSKKRTWTTSGTYYDTLRNYAFCDSVITINLTINHAERDTVNNMSCRYFIMPKTGKPVYFSGLYSDTFTRVKKCDSIVVHNVEIIQNDLTVIHDGSLLTAKLGMASYQWVYCDRNMTPIDQATNQSFVAKSNESYAVIITKNGCTDTSECVVVVNAGSKSINKSLTNIYPNPSRGVFEISSPNLAGSTIVIYNSVGVKMTESKVTSGTKTSIQTSNWPDGIYQVQIRRGTETEQISVVVQK